MILHAFRSIDVDHDAAGRRRAALRHERSADALGRHARPPAARTPAAGPTDRTAAGPRTPSPLPGLTSLRWLAAFVVFGYHIRLTGWFDGTAGTVTDPVFGAGHTGVAFFLLSGQDRVYSAGSRPVGVREVAPCAADLGRLTGRRLTDGTDRASAGRGGRAPSKAHHPIATLQPSSVTDPGQPVRACG